MKSAAGRGSFPALCAQSASSREPAARIGYVAKALLYATVGILAAEAALGRGGRTTDLGGALREVVRAPMGEALLLVIALGLAGYAIWRMLDAITDAEGRGGDAKGLARRVGSAARGIGHGALAVAAFGLATAACPSTASPGGARRPVRRPHAGEVRRLGLSEADSGHQADGQHKSQTRHRSCEHRDKSSWHP